MKTIFAFFLLISSFAGKAQNLVVNGDFELYDQCPTVIGSVNGYLQSAYNPHPEATTDYYNSCDIQPNPCEDFGHVSIPLNAMGYQEAQSGDGYIGLFLFEIPFEYREYIVLHLTSTLIKDSIYKISFYVSKPETFGKATDAIMVAFTEDSVPMNSFDYGILNLNGLKMADSPINDNENWILLSKSYKACGNENYLVIGNFLHDSETLIENGNYVPWNCGQNEISGADSDVYLYIDNVIVEQHSEQAFFPNVFTPNADGINDRFANLIYGYTIIRVEIFNRWGTNVYFSNNGDVNWDGKVNEQSCEDGVYFYSALIQNNTTGEIITKQGTVTLIK